MKTYLIDDELLLTIISKLNKRKDNELIKKLNKLAIDNGYINGYVKGNMDGLKNNICTTIAWKLNIK